MGILAVGPMQIIGYAIAAIVISSPVIGVLVVLLHFVVGKVPLGYNLRNLTLRWKTTLMTALAFTLVISLLTVMLAFVNGMYALTKTSGQPGNVMILSDGATDEGFSNLGFSDIGDIENQKGILRDGDRPLLSRETYLIVNQPIANPALGRPKRRFLQVRGLDDPSISGKVHGLDLYPGGDWFSSAGVRNASGDEQPIVETVLGEGVARVIAGDRTEAEKNAARNPERLDVGDEFSLGSRKWVVTGVLQSAGSTFDSEVWAKRDLVGKEFGKSTYTTLVARTENRDEALKLKDFFNKDYKKAAVAAQVETDYFESLSATNKQFLYSIILVAVVMAVGGMFGIMNTMFAAISQRRTDIGVLGLLGFTRFQILISFLLESVVIAVAGGLLGLAVGSLCHGWTATSIVGSNQGGGKFVVLKLVVDQTILAAGIVLALAMGVAGGFLPAINTMRLKPLETLR